MGAGTPQQVVEDVERRIHDLAPGGGFVLGSVHNIRANVPPENIAAMFEAAREFGGYLRLGGLRETGADSAIGPCRS